MKIDLTKEMKPVTGSVIGALMAVVAASFFLDFYFSTFLILSAPIFVWAVGLDMGRLIAAKQVEETLKKYYSMDK
jgi:hypothetical protein